jgi:D-beta-D-heptose 7-phosphate kinase/D-beta-D-heptose 1-phosphate adenosyltransferase
LLEGFSRSRILLVGDVMLDEYIWGHVRRICPEAPVPIVEEVRRSSVPGGMANVATNAAALGAEVEVGGVTGDDSQGRALRERLDLLGIDTSGLRSDQGRPTTLKVRVIAHNQQVVRVDRENTLRLSSGLEKEILDWFGGRLPVADCCILSDYAKGVLSPALTSELIKRATLRGVPVIVDPKGWDYRKYRGASIITPNLHEACMALTNGGQPPTDISVIGTGLLDLLPGTAVLVSRGSEGIALFQDLQSPLYIPSIARQVYDVTGAGDTLVATLAVAIAAGCSLKEAAELANFAAGLAVGKVGTAAVRASELLEVVRLINRGDAAAELVKA